MKLEVIVKSGLLIGSRFVFSQVQEVIIGRHSACGLVLEDEGVSRRHCRVVLGDPPTVEDLGSRNGTAVNGRSVDGPTPVGVADNISVGRVILSVQCQPISEEVESEIPSTEVLSRGLLNEHAPELQCAGCGGPAKGVPFTMSKARLCPECRESLKLDRTMLGRYTVLAMIGEGATAKVYRAMDEDEQLLALKVFQIQPMTQQAMLERIIREAKLTSVLCHPNVVSLLDADVVDSTLFVAYEYVHGGDLKKVVEQTGPMDPRQVISIGRQICSALAHAHFLSVIHRDLKPANVLLGAGDLIKVTDFGIAKPINEATTDAITGSGATLGTPSYMPPEQQGSARHADERSDLYSLGATMYHLLTGRPPYQGALFEIFEALKSPDPVPAAIELRPDIPVPLDLLLRRVLEKEPQRRFATAVELEAALAQVASFLGSEP